jgi:hypothetical protein
VRNEYYDVSRCAHRRKFRLLTRPRYYIVFIMRGAGIADELLTSSIQYMSVFVITCANKPNKVAASTSS